MRKDMRKVFTEGHKYRKQRHERRAREANYDLEELPVKISGMKEAIIAGGGYRGKGRRYGPMRKFLASRVGHLWDDVYAEACAELPVGNDIAKELREQIDWMVELHPIFGEDGLVYSKSGTRLSQLRHNELYVDQHGILRIFKDKPKKKYVQWDKMPLLEHIAHEYGERKEYDGRVKKMIVKDEELYFVWKNKKTGAWERPNLVTASFAHPVVGEEKNPWGNYRFYSGSDAVTAVVQKRLKEAKKSKNKFVRVYVDAIVKHEESKLKNKPTFSQILRESELTRYQKLNPNNEIRSR